jgi:hypothetical protein
MSDPKVPIACTLSGTSLATRVHDIGVLLARSLHRSRRDGRHLHLTFAPEAKADVENLVRKEKACCTFLEFELTGSPGSVDLVIGVPPDAADAAETLLARFTIRTGN